LLAIDAGVAGVRIDQRNDLASIRRIGQNFLITGHRRVEHDFAGRSTGSPDGTAAKQRPVGERENRWDGRGGHGVFLYRRVRRVQMCEAGKACSAIPASKATNYTLAVDFLQSRSGGALHRALSGVTSRPGCLICQLRTRSEARDSTQLVRRAPSAHWPMSAT